MELSPNSKTSTEGSNQAVDWLFSELFGMYGNAFVDKYRSGIVVAGVDTGIENMKQVWLDKLRANGITRRQLARGLEGCQRLKFPPSWPEFLDCCLPARDAVAAYHEAIAGLEARARGEMGEWSHRAVFWAAREIQTDLASQTQSAVKDRWAAALRRQFERTEWPPIPAPMPELPAPGKTPTSAEHAAATLRALGASGILQRMPRTGDQKQWITRLQERAARGEQGLSTYALRAAREVAARNNQDDDGEDDVPNQDAMD